MQLLRRRCDDDAVVMTLLLSSCLRVAATYTCYASRALSGSTCKHRPSFTAIRHLLRRLSKRRVVRKPASVFCVVHVANASFLFMIAYAAFQKEGKRAIVMIAVVVFSYKICQGRCTLPEKHDRMNLSQKTGRDTSEAPSPAPKVLVKRVIPFPP